ncbi:Uncharacterized protein APZ42_023407 [Daphnia magna]|uniref:Uncharacterized protein n=1 Tax=Daphnia magna TaxID=35525 RepID=A0A164UZD9_9CRUS|nr:Uncharacterized protein APZ42_023407 [Daphnia magna]
MEVFAKLSEGEIVEICAFASAQTSFNVQIKRTGIQTKEEEKKNTFNSFVENKRGILIKTYIALFGKGTAYLLLKRRMISLAF